MDIRRFTPDDTAVVEAVVELRNAAQKVDAPFNYPLTVDDYVGWLRHGWDGEAPESHAAWVGDRLAGLLEIYTSEWDNLHLAWLDVRVHPDVRGNGHGAQLVAAARERVRELGRTSLGGDAWDGSPGVRFAERHGLTRRSAGIKRRQTLAKVDQSAVGELYAEALPHASGYELVRQVGRTPRDLLPEVAEMAAAINDAPTDDLDIEDEVYSPERIASYERAQEARGRRLYRVLARSRETGELAGHTVVAVESERPWIGDQHDTSVVASHRGHRLGLVLKLEMLRWLAEAEPALETIDTWNAESNDFMVRVNEQMGYEILGRVLELQGDL